MIRSRVTQAGGSAWLTAALYHPFIRYQVSLWRWGYIYRGVSISPPASTILLCRYAFRIALIVRSRRCMRDWSYARSHIAVTLVPESLHVASRIQLFFLASLVLRFRIALHRAANIPSSLFRVREGAARASQGTWRVPSVWCCGVNLAPCSGMDMPWVLDGNIPEETKIRSQDIICLGTHLSPQPDHAPHPPVPTPGDPSREELCGHILQTHRLQRRRNLFFSSFSLSLHQV